jgi:hypothetical protein
LCSVLGARQCGLDRLWLMSFVHARCFFDIVYHLVFAGFFGTDSLVNAVNTPVH